MERGQVDMGFEDIMAWASVFCFCISRAERIARRLRHEIRKTSSVDTPFVLCAAISKKPCPV